MRSLLKLPMMLAWVLAAQMALAPGYGLAQESPESVKTEANRAFDDSAAIKKSKVLYKVRPFKKPKNILKIIEKWAAKSHRGLFFQGLITQEAYDASQKGSWAAGELSKNKMLQSNFNTVFFSKRITTEAGRELVREALAAGYTRARGWLDREWVVDTDDQALIKAVQAAPGGSENTVGFIYGYDATLPPMTMRSEPILVLLTQEDVSNNFKWVDKKIKTRMAVYESPNKDYVPKLPR